jgi:hypothetical protein
MNKENSPAEKGSTLDQRKKSIFKNLGEFIKRNPTLTVSIIAIGIILGLWSFMKIDKTRMGNRYKTQMVLQRDSINIGHTKNNVRIFSWAVRSELIRGNKEQVEHFFTNYLETGKVVRVLLIDPETSKVIISTNKKDVDTTATDNEILDATAIITIDAGETYMIANPIMGLDKKIGILVVEIEK